MLTSVSFVNKNASVIDNIGAILRADRELYSGSHTAAVTNVFLNRGFPVTWSRRVSMAGDVTVPAGATLTIAAACTVDVTVHASDYELKVEGKLTAVGTSTDSIYFRSTNNGTTKSEWYGIVFSSGSSATSSVKYCAIKNAYKGISVSSAGPTIANNNISYSHYGIKLDGLTSSGEIDDNDVSNCYHGIYGSNMTSPTIKENTLTDNIYGLRLSDVDGTGTGIRDNTMTGNGTGLRLSDCTVPVHDCTVDDNDSGAEIRSETSSTLDGCTFDSNDDDWGIYAYGDSGPELLGCRIALNKTYGIKMFNGADPDMDDSSEANEIYHNGTYELYLADDCMPLLDDDTSELNDIVTTFPMYTYAIYINTAYDYKKVTARHNWWGASPPTSNMFSPADSVDHSSHSTSQNLTGYPKAVVDAARSAFEEAERLERRGDPAGAVSLYRDILGSHTRHRLVRPALSRIYRASRNGEEDMLSLSGFYRAIEERATDPGIARKARNLRLRCLLHAGRIDEALAGYGAIGRESPGTTESAMARVKLGDIYHEYLERPDVAVDLYSQVADEFSGREEGEIARMALADLGVPGLVAEVVGTSDLLDSASQEIVLESYPNPTNPTTVVRFSLPTGMPVGLRVYNALGQTVRILVPLEFKPPGVHEVVWDGRDSQDRAVGGGVYLVQLRAGERVQSKKLTIIK